MDEPKAQLELDRRERWEQQPAEPYSDFLRFQRFLNLGYRRTLRKLYLAECKDEKKDPKSTPNSLLKLATLWEWEARANAHDEAKIAEDAKLLALRRAEVREEEFGIAQLLLSKAKDMLKFPLQQVSRTGEDGSVTIINPAEWRLTDVVVLAKAASELQRLSLDMSQGRVEVTPISSAAAHVTPLEDMQWLKETVARGGAFVEGVVVESNDSTGTEKPEEIPAGNPAPDQSGT